MKKYFFLSFFVIGLVGVLPTITLAYKSTAEYAIPLKNGGALYGIAYDFGSELYDFKMPALPVRHSSSTDTDKELSYALVTEDGEASAYGETMGVVVTNATLNGGEYMIPKGEARRFILLVLVLPEGAEADELALSVTSLPFTMTGKDGTQAGRLNPSELQYYKTPAIDIPAKAK